MYRVFAVSDGTAGTAERALNAALTQFVGAEVQIERRATVRSEEQIRQVVQEAAEIGGFIVHTLVTDRLRDAMLREGRLHNVEAIASEVLALVRRGNAPAAGGSGKVATGRS